MALSARSNDSAVLLVIVMGNHEFNALGYHTPDGKGEYLRPHSDKNCDQHAETLAYFEKNPGAADRALTWFHTFPLWLDLGFARVVHAAWSPIATGLLKTPYLTPEILVKASTKGTPEYRAVENCSKRLHCSVNSISKTRGVFRTMLPADLSGHAGETRCGGDGSRSRRSPWCRFPREENRALFSSYFRPTISVAGSSSSLSIDILQNTDC
jgi:hypothetical protein